MALKNNDQRRQYLNNADNWHQVIRWNNFRIMKLEYRGEEFFRVDTYEFGQHFNATSINYHTGNEWMKCYSRWHISDNGMELVNNTQVIAILREADKHEPKKKDVVTSIFESTEAHEGSNTNVKCVQNA